MTKGSCSYNVISFCLFPFSTWVLIKIQRQNEIRQRRDTKTSSIKQYWNWYFAWNFGLQKQVFYGGNVLRYWWLAFSYMIRHSNAKSAADWSFSVSFRDVQISWHENSSPIDDFAAVHDSYRLQQLDRSNFGTCELKITFRHARFRQSRSRTYLALDSSVTLWKIVET